MSTGTTHSKRRRTAIATVGRSEDSREALGETEEFKEDPESELESESVAEEKDIINVPHEDVLNFSAEDDESNQHESTDGSGVPFGDPQTLILMSLFNGYANLLSRSELETLHYAFGQITELAYTSAKENKPFKLPSANKIMRDDKNKRYDGPRMNIAASMHNVVIQKNAEIRNTSANMPSEHLMLSHANPKEAQFLDGFPDRTPDVPRGLTTGKKWGTYPHFQPPQVTVCGYKPP
ncbi:hypothetical protein CLU79DRAFT_752283 [Phycomyces nitens]|nr:hypothetical protein CLU79DRAFT_752283 [Phycomyces nitens]